MQMNRGPDAAASRRKHRKPRDGKTLRASAEKRRESACTPRPDLQGVASATECTGAVPALPPEDQPER